MLLFYYIYFFLIALPLLLVATILACLSILIGLPLGAGEMFGHRVASLWARIFCILSLVKVTVKGEENINKNTSYVFVANHQGYYDIFSTYGYMKHDFKWMMKKSLGKIWLVGYTCKKMGHIFVDRSTPSAVRRTIETAEKQLRDGMSIVVFPEGARTFTGKMGPFKKGAYQLALEFHLPLVPVTIDGSFKVMPRTRFLPRPGHITLTIHKPIAPPDTEAERIEVMEKSREAIASAL